MKTLSMQGKGNK